jgi:signal transduction histidine kinase
LSHQLHSSKLDYLGIAAGLRSFGKEFSKQHRVNVAFTEHDVPNPLSEDVSLCLFRVAQEALHNALKHSGATQFTLDLRSTSEGVRLEVTDAGAGFDVKEAERDRGLGLVSMQERVQLVYGTFAIDSRPGQGTRIVIVVPAVANNGASSAVA